MDKLYVIYKKDEMIKDISNGYNTLSGVRAVVTQKAKKDLQEDGLIEFGKVANASEYALKELEKAKEAYEIRTFVNSEGLSVWGFIKRLWD